MPRKNEVEYDAYYRILSLVYTEHNPSKLDNIDNLLKKYSKKYHALYHKICKKYGVKPMKHEDILQWREEEIAQEENESEEESEGKSEYSEHEEEVYDEEQVKDETDEFKQGPGGNRDRFLSELSHQKTMQFFQEDFNHSIDLSELSTISVLGRTIIFPENTKASIGTSTEADGATIDVLTKKSDEFVSVFNNTMWSKIPTLFTQDCVISVSDRNFYGREAAEIVFKSIRTQAGKDKSGCGPSLNAKRSSFEILSKNQIRENGTYEHDLQEEKHYSFTWKVDRNRYQIFLFQW